MMPENAAALPALAAIFGSLTGALMSCVSTWITQRHQNRRDLVARKLFHREQLYSEFIREAAAVIADALEHNFQDPAKLAPTYALLSRIRLTGSPEVLAAGERVIQLILHTYAEPSPSPEEIQSRASKGEDPLRDFSVICRRELDLFWNQY
ncbi:MAG: hypothetical protein JOZ43_07550 [Acidobacteriales bacterium]|nr:hypothetical protein [Terriglobales bacterium]